MEPAEEPDEKDNRDRYEQKTSTHIFLPIKDVSIVALSRPDFAGCGVVHMEHT